MKVKNGMENFKFKCAECKTIKDCKHAFGIYWAYRSHMGQGCDLQFAYKRERRALPPPTRKLEQRTMI